MDKYLLSIAITSYNRVTELKRCLESIDAKETELIEIIVSEDKSPRKNEIQKVVEEYASSSSYRVLFNSNKQNLGYDRNLKKLIDLSESKYVLYLSDDDKLIPKQLDIVIDVLKNNPKGVMYSPFFIPATNEYRRKYSNGGPFPSGEKYMSKHIFDSILFSGLIFERDIVSSMDGERFKNAIYMQTYMFLLCGHFHGGYYFPNALVECVSDGENGFGISESSNNKKLAEKDSPLANPEYDKCIIRVIKMFDDDYHTDYIHAFESEYNLRLATMMGMARKMGKAALNDYWKQINNLGIKINAVGRMYYFLYKVFGYKFVDTLLSVPKKILLLARGEQQ